MSRDLFSETKDFNIDTKTLKKSKPICHTLISIALIFYADMNLPGDDHQGTKVELARDGEEIHCWQTSLEEVVASVFGVFCISVFA